MAARVSNSTRLGSRYTNDEEPIETRLPSGRCNYTNLSVGGNAPVCGCRRFWVKALTGPRVASTASSGFCMCEHHACFHDDVPRQRQPGAVAAVAMVDRMPK